MCLRLWRGAVSTQCAHLRAHGAISPPERGVPGSPAGEPSGSGVARRPGTTAVAGAGSRGYVTYRVGPEQPTRTLGSPCVNIC